MRIFKNARERQGYLSNFLGWPTKIIVLITLAFVVLLPFYWLVTNAFKVEEEYFAQPPVLVPTKITFQNFIDIFTKFQVAKGLLNSILILMFL